MATKYEAPQGLWGGGGGVTFDGNQIGGHIPSWYGLLEDQQEIAMLGFNAGGYIIDSIWLWERPRDYTSKLPPHFLWHEGGDGAPWTQFSLDPGEYIWAVRGRVGTYVDYIEFCTSSHRVYHIGGKGGQTPFAVNFDNDGNIADTNWELCGFYGQRMTHIDCIGFYFRDRSTLPPATPVAARPEDTRSAQLIRQYGRVIQVPRGPYPRHGAFEADVTPEGERTRLGNNSTIEDSSRQR